MPDIPTPTAEPKYGERLDTSWTGQRLELPYHCSHCTTRDEARTALLTAAPATLAGYPTASGTVATLTLTDTRLEEVPGEGKAWNAWAIYTIVQATAFRTTGEDVFQFDTGGSTQQIVQAIKHGATVACAGATSTPDFKGAINVNGDGDIGGVNVPSPAFRFSITMYKPKSQVNQSYLEALYKATGKVNSADITVRCNGESMSFAAGELLLEGASGGLRGNQDWEITLRFAASPNVADICADWDPAVRPAAPVPKKGWEYAWVYYEEFYDQSSSPPRRVKRPQTVNIEQVYYTTPFAALGMP